MKKKLLTLLLFCLIFCSSCGIKLKSNKPVDKEVITNMIGDIYTSKSVDAFKNARDKYIKDGYITPDVATQMFNIDPNVTEFTQDDLNRQVNITNIAYSNKDNNSFKEDLYKVNVLVTYKNEPVAFSLKLYVNSEGKIYKFDKK